MSGQVIQVNEQQIELGQELGKGAYGVVFDCKILNIEETQNKFCIKILSTFDEKGSQREAEILTLLSQQQNQNLVGVKTVEYNKQERKMLVVMDKCESNLQTYWNKKQIFSPSEVKDFLRQILNGYKTLHENNVIHRDLKPENILIKIIGNQIIYQIADFGVGKILKNNDFILTKKTGTPVYSPPECNPVYGGGFCTADPDLDDDEDLCIHHCSLDMYSIGMIMYQLLFGTFPFPTNLQGIYEFVKNLKTTPIQIPDIKNQDQDLVYLIKKMIVYFPTKRITFEELEKFTFEKQSFKENESDTTFSTKDSNQQVIYPNPPPSIRIVTQINPNLSHTNYGQINRIPTQPNPQPPIRMMTMQTMNQSHISSHEIAKQTLMMELIETLTFILDSMKNNGFPQQDSLIINIVNSIEILKQSNIKNPQQIFHALQGIRNHFRYQLNKNYTKSYIRFLFIFTYFADCKFIPNPDQVSLEQMSVYLQQWSKTQ